MKINLPTLIKKLERLESILAGAESRGYASEINAIEYEIAVLCNQINNMEI